MILIAIPSNEPIHPVNGLGRFLDVLKSTDALCRSSMILGRPGSPMRRIMTLSVSKNIFRRVLDLTWNHPTNSQTFAPAIIRIVIAGLISGVIVVPLERSPILLFLCKYGLKLSSNLLYVSLLILKAVSNSISVKIEEHDSNVMFFLNGEVILLLFAKSIVLRCSVSFRRCWIWMNTATDVIAAAIWFLETILKWCSAESWVKLSVFWIRIWLLLYLYAEEIQV